MKYSGQPIQTFIFLDLEATDLPSPGTRPRITELSLLAVNRNNLLTLAVRDEPRVIDKITICINPMKPMNHSAGSITGLYNDTLCFHRDLDEGLATMILMFLQRHQSPICLIAHNGNKFDFPLLRSELASVQGGLPDGILCVDSLLLYRDIDDVIPTPAVRRVLFASDSGAKGTALSNDSGTKGPVLSSDSGAMSTALNNDSGVKSTALSSDSSAMSTALTSDSVSETTLLINCSDSELRADPNRHDTPCKLENGALSLERKKQKTFHMTRRRLSYDGIRNETADYNGNDLDREAVRDTGSPEGQPLLENPLATCNDLNSEELFLLPISPSRSPDTVSVITENESQKVSIVPEKSIVIDPKSTTAHCSTSQHYRELEVSSGDLAKRMVWFTDGEKSDNSTGATRLLAESTVISSLWDAGDDSISDAELLEGGVLSMTGSQCSPPAQLTVVDPSDDSVAGLGKGKCSSKMPPKGVCIDSETATDQINQSVHDTTENTEMVCTPTRSSIPEEISRLGTHAPKKMHPFSRDHASSKRRLSYKLSHLHRRVLGYDPPVCHRAEEDSMSLLRLFHKTSSVALPWSDTHAVPLNSIAFMYEPKTRKTLADEVYPYH